MNHLGIQASLVFYAACPRCSTLYPENEFIPERCSALDKQGSRCDNPILLGRRRGNANWKKPRRRYSHQLFEVWLAGFLNRPEIEGLIENVRPCLQSDCTDFWGAPYLNSFPGPGEKGFFEAPIEDLRLAFMIYHDFFNPFTNKMAGKQKSIGVIMMVCLNLPPSIRYNRENIYTAAVIPGPSEPSREEINHFMRPIAQNLKEHYNPGVWISRTHKYPNGRHVWSAAMVESMDLIASRAWGGIGPPTHTILCSFCGVHRDEIDIFEKVHPLRTMSDHIQHVHLWMNAPDSSEREKLWKANAARYSEMLCFPWWSPFSAPIAPMHWIKNILEKQLRENMDWSWTLPTGIPSGPKVMRPVTRLELSWGKAAMTYCSANSLSNTKLTEPILRHLCTERGIFNMGLPSSRMVLELNLWRRQRGIIDASGELVQRLPEGWADDQVSLAKVQYYLTKSKKASYLVQKSRVNDLKQLCDKYQLSRDGTHQELASRLVKHYSRTPREPEPVGETEESKPQESFAVLGREVMAEIQQDMERTVIPSWMKTPPKEFGRISHGKIGSEEYKSLALVSLTFTLVRLWTHGSRDFIDRLNHFLHLTQAIRVISYQSISKPDIEMCSRHYMTYLGQLKSLYPHCSITPTQHLGLHIPHFLEILGPAPRFNENPSEMFIGMLQDIPMNWRFGELEYTLHKEFIAASNLQALLQQPQIASAIGDVGEAVSDYLEARHPAHTGVYAKGWNVTHPSTVSLLNDEVYDPLVRFCSDRQAHPPTRRQFMCTKVQNGHVVYQPESVSLGNSQILFEVPETQEWAAGRIESIILQSDQTGSPHPPQLQFLVRRFKLLSAEDRIHDPYWSNSIIGANGSKTAAMFYDELESGLPTFLQAKDIAAHVVTYQYHDARKELSAPCIAVLSFNLNHPRLS
ncbi:hypothetical protein FRC12_000660 [Ceratobasidium sp. 428]|nr:hypothetical protein FRC12_000660 [Ceratobasidium sp. 428]